MMLWSLPDCPSAVWRKLHVLTILLVTSHFSEQTRAASVNIGGPHLLLWLLQVAGRVRDVPVAADFRSASVDQGFAIRRETDRRDALSIVALIVCHLARSEAGSVGDPDVTFALAVENPGNAIG